MVYDFNLGDIVYIIPLAVFGKVTQTFNYMGAISYLVRPHGMMDAYSFIPSELKRDDVKHAINVCECGCTKYYGTSWPKDKHDSYCPIYKEVV